MRPIRAFFSLWTAQPDITPPRRSLWLKVGVVSAALLVTGVGTLGVSMLLRLPEFAGCRSIDWDEESSASLRLHCAQVIANSHTVEDLVEGIRLADGIPPDQSLRKDSDRLIKQWSFDLIDLAETAFHKGSIQEATNILRRVPLNPDPTTSLDDRITKWQAVWSKAETIYRDAEAEIPQSNWEKAFGLAKSLLSVGNEYWATTKYQALLAAIQDAKEKKGDRPKSTKTATAPKPLTPSSRPNLPSADDLIGRWRQDQEAKDLSHLEKARTLARTGDAESLRSAIDEAGRVLYGNSNYAEAQSLIDSLTRQAQSAEDRTYLDRATKLASKGDEPSLQAAINQVYQIGGDRSLHQEAQNRAQQWSQQIQQLRQSQLTQSPQPRSQDFYNPAIVPPPTSTLPPAPSYSPTLQKQ